MSVEKMAADLEKLALNLRHNSTKLTSEVFEKPFNSFQKSLSVFVSALENLLLAEREAPLIRALNERFNLPAAKILDDPAVFTAFTKGVLGKKFSTKKAEPTSKTHQRFIQHLISNQLVPKGIKHFDNMINQANMPKLDLTSETLLLREIRHIGSLSDEALEIALATRYKNDLAVRKMAEAAHLKLTKKQSYSTIVKKLITYARNAFANTSF